jgi:hypothetical protein
MPPMAGMLFAEESIIWSLSGFNVSLFTDRLGTKREDQSPISMPKENAFETFALSFSSMGCCPKGL